MRRISQHLQKLPFLSSLKMEKVHYFRQKSYINEIMNCGAYASVDLPCFTVRVANLLDVNQRGHEFQRYIKVPNSVYCWNRAPHGKRAWKLPLINSQRETIDVVLGLFAKSGTLYDIRTLNHNRFVPKEHIGFQLLLALKELDRFEDRNSLIKHFEDGKCFESLFMQSSNIIPQDKASQRFPILEMNLHPSNPRDILFNRLYSSPGGIRDWKRLQKSLSSSSENRNHFEFFLYSLHYYEHTHMPLRTYIECKQFLDSHSESMEVLSSNLISSG